MDLSSADIRKLGNAMIYIVEHSGTPVEECKMLALLCLMEATMARDYNAPFLAIWQKRNAKTARKN